MNQEKFKLMNLRLSALKYEEKITYKKNLPKYT